MDPLSITASVASLLGACIKVATTLKSFRDASLHVDSKVKGLITEMDLFVETLSSMRNTLNDNNVQYSRQLTGHIGDHWRSIHECIKDGLKTVDGLHLVLHGIDKSVRLFGTVRKQLRFREATEEIAIYQQQIRSYRETIQLSLQTAIFWNSVSTNDATVEALPKLDELALLIRNLGKDLNRRLAMVERMVESPERDAQIRSIQSLRSCIRTSADVVSSASTTLGVSDTRSVLAPSDYQDGLPARKQSVMLRWLAEVGNTAQYMSHSQAMGSVYGELGVIEDSDSDVELEVEMIQLQLQKGKELAQTGNKDTAAKLLAAGISRLKHHRSRYLDAERKLSMLDDLLQPLEEQGNWVEAKKIRLEKLAVLSSDMTTQSGKYLEETLRLVEYLLRARDTKEGRIYARKCIKAYRKLGLDGIEGLRQALALMITACHLEADEAEEEMYKAMLVQLNMSPESDSVVEEATDLILPAEMDASSASIFTHWTENVEEATSFASIPPKLLIEEMEEESELNPPESMTDFVRNLFKTVVPPDLDITSAFNSDRIEEVSNPTGTTDVMIGDHVSMDDRSSEVITPLSWTNKKDKRRGIWFKEGGPYAEMQGSSSEPIETVYSCQLDLANDFSGPRGQGIEDSATSVLFGDLSSPEAQNETKTNSSSIYELDAVAIVITGVDYDVRHELSASPPMQIKRAFSWKHDKTEQTDLRANRRLAAADAGAEEPHSVLDVSSNVYSEPSITLSTWISAMHDDSISSLPNPTEMEDLTTIEVALLSPEAADKGGNIYIHNPVSTDDTGRETNENEVMQPKVRVTTVIMGPSCSGKSSLIQAFTSGDLGVPEVYNGLTSYFANMTEPTTMQPIDMVIWDTSGEITDLYKLECAQDVDCVVLCMSVDSSDSIEDIEDIWIPEIRIMFPGRPLILVAMRVDLRNDSKTIDYLHIMGFDPLSPSQGRMIMERIGAVNYFDCSVKSQEGVGDLFHEVALQGLQAKTGLQAKKGARRSKSLWDLTKQSFRKSR